MTTESPTPQPASATNEQTILLDALDRDRRQANTAKLEAVNRYAAEFAVAYAELREAHAMLGEMLGALGPHPEPSVYFEPDFAHEFRRQGSLFSQAAREISELGAIAERMVSYAIVLPNNALCSVAP